MIRRHPAAIHIIQQPSAIVAHLRDLAKWFADQLLRFSIK
jgi:hypothetical protein